MISKKVVVENFVKDIKDLLTIGYTIYSIGIDTYRNESSVVFAHREHCFNFDNNCSIFCHLDFDDLLNKWVLDGIEQVAPHRFTVRGYDLKEITELAIYPKVHKVYYQYMWAERWQKYDEYDAQKLGKLTQKEIKELLTYVKDRMMVELDIILEEYKQE
jgi:hypothetical protein